jgi:aminobenzoyl-glutamate utilization protein B
MHYAITNAGGLSPNVVPAKADVLYMIRLPDVSQLGELQERVNDIARGAALMTGTQMSWETIKACANYLPNRTLSEEVYQAMQDIPLPSFSEKERAYAKRYVAPSNAARDLEKVASAVRDRSVVREILQHRDDVISSFLVPYDADAPLRMSYGSTDVGDVSWNCPTAQFVAATWAPGTRDTLAGPPRQRGHRPQDDAVERQGHRTLRHSDPSESFVAQGGQRRVPGDDADPGVSSAFR